MPFAVERAATSDSVQYPTILVNYSTLGRMRGGIGRPADDFVDTQAVTKQCFGKN